MECFDNLSINISYEPGMDRNIQTISIKAERFDENFEKLETIATAKLKRILWLSTNHEDNLFDFDSISQQLHRLSISCLKEDEDGSSKFVNDDDHEFDGMIYIEEVRVDEEYRRCGIGKAFIQETIKALGNYDDILIVLPFPIEANGNTKAKKKVINFWESLGFERVNKTDFWSMPSEELKGRKDFLENASIDNQKKLYNFKEVN